MKSYMDTLVKIFGDKQSYKKGQIQAAYNVFVQAQISDTTFRSDLKPDSKYFIINCPLHKWHSKRVWSTGKQNRDGWVLVHYGSSTDHVKPIFLEKDERTC